MRQSSPPLVLVFTLVALFSYTCSYILFTSSPEREDWAVYDLDDLPPSPPPWTDRLIGPSKARQLQELQALLSQRICGSPAIDGYEHVKPACLLASPTNQWWNRTKPRPEDLIIHLERHSDYDGLAVAWGIGNKKQSVEECAQACHQHVPKGNGPFGWLPCNAFTFCSEEVCFEPDAHSHSKGDCWLKFTEGPANPEVNMRGHISEEQKQRHPNAPDIVQWHSGVLLPRGIALRNGTWSPRYKW